MEKDIGTLSTMCSPKEVLRSFTSRLEDAIVDPDKIASELFSARIIEKRTRQKVQHPGKTTTEKSTVLLEAVECALESNEKTMEGFLDILDKHTSVENVSSEMRGDLNHSNPFKLYCEDCRQLVCQHCMVDSHRSHNCRSTNEAYADHKHTLETELQSIDHHLLSLTTADERIGKIMDDITAQGENVKQQIHDATEQLIELLKEAEKTQCEKVDVAMTTKLHLLSQQKERLNEVKANIKSCKEYIEKKVQEEAPHQVLLKEDEMMGTTKTICAYTSAIELKPEEEANMTFTASSKVKPHEFEDTIGKFQYFYNNSYTASNITATGRGKEVAMAGNDTTFVLTTPASIPLPHDKISCQIRTTTIPHSPIQIRSTPTSPRSCTLCYTPVIRGAHVMTVKVADYEIPGSPFNIRVLPNIAMRGKPLHTYSGFNRPHSIAVGDRGHVVVAEENCITKCYPNNDQSGLKHRLISLEDHKGQITGPVALAFRNDDIIIAYRCQLQVLTLDGEVVQMVGKKGVGDLMFSAIRGIAVHSSGKIFIADTGNHRIQVLNTDLTFSHKFGSIGSGQGQFVWPFDVAIGEDEMVYVADTSNSRIQKLTEQGKFLAEFRIKGNYMPKAICVDPTNTIYVTGNEQIMAFNSDGQLLKSFGEGLHQKVYKCAIAVNKFGDLYVCDEDSKFVYVY